MKDNSVITAKTEDTLLPQAGMSPSVRILVVEDDREIRRFTTQALARSGYEVDAAEDGAAGWDALQLNSYDLLVTDNKMPKVSGVELLEKLHTARLSLPVIMATGTVPTEFARFPWLRPDVTLLKPFTLEEMLSTVKKVLSETADAQMNIHFDSKNHPGPPSAKPAHTAPPGPVNYHRILVVDEDKDLQLLYTDALTRPGYHVDVVEDGEAGWEALQTKNYNLLITENDIPKLTGVELVRKVRAARMALPVVMAAGRLPEHELARNPSLQLAATLAKPFAVEVLLDTVRNVLCATDTRSTPIAPPDGQGRWPADEWQL